MVYVRSLRFRSTSSATPSGRRIATATIALGAICAIGLSILFASAGFASGTRPAPEPRLSLSGSPGPSSAGVEHPGTPAPGGSAIPGPAGPAPGAMSDPPARLGFNLGFDPGDSLRAPEAGSQPSVAPTPPNAAPSAATVAEQSTDRWGFLHRSATGQALFLTGFLLLLLSISGLVTVGFYRRRW